MIAPPTTPRRNATGHEQAGDRGQPERGDPGIGRVGGGDAKPGDEPVQLTVRDRAPDREQADRADGGRDREADDQAAERERKIEFHLGASDCGGSPAANSLGDAAEHET